MPNDGRVDDSIPIHFRDIGKIQSGTMVSVSYNPVRGKYGPRDRFGTVTEAETRADGRLRFRFDDKDREREIDVVLGPTAGESRIRSRKSERWTTLGTPLRISARNDIQDRSNFHRETASEFFEGRHESIVAAAQVEWNSRILDWLTWSEKNA